MEKQNHARSLYMNEGKTQKEIAEIVGVSERTIYNWIKQFAWDKLRQAAFHAPAIIADNIFSQVVELQTFIAEREPGKRFPTQQEAETTRKLLCCLDKVKSATSLAQNMQMLESFRRFVYTKNEKVAGSIGLFEEQYLEANAVRGFKPYEMAYHPYTMSPFEYFESQAPAEDQSAPLHNNTFPPKHPEETTIMVGNDGSITESSTVPENPETEIISQPEKAAPESFETIDKEVDCVKESTETDRKKPEISGNLDAPVSGVPSQHSGTAETHKETPEIDPLFDLTLSTPALSEVEGEIDGERSEIPITMSSAYFMTLPPHRRPSPFREGNIIWINNVKDITDDIAKNLKMGDVIRHYPDIGSNAKDRRA